MRAEGSVASATARNNDGAREGGEGRNEERKNTDKDKVKGRSDAENTRSVLLLSQELRSRSVSSSHRSSGAGSVTV